MTLLQFLDLRVAVLGNVDSGKSTLLGVLTQGELDNGRGRARLNLFRHLHEIQTGRTSSISIEILGFDSKGEVRAAALCASDQRRLTEERQFISIIGCQVSLLLGSCKQTKLKMCLTPFYNRFWLAWTCLGCVLICIFAVFFH